MLVMSNFMVSSKPGIKICELGKEISDFVSVTDGYLHFWILNYKDYQIHFMFMLIEEIYVDRRNNCLLRFYCS